MSAAATRLLNNLGSRRDKTGSGGRRRQQQQQQQQRPQEGEGKVPSAAPEGAGATSSGSTSSTQPHHHHHQHTSPHPDLHLRPYLNTRLSSVSDASGGLSPGDTSDSTSISTHSDTNNHNVTRRSTARQPAIVNPHHHHHPLQHPSPRPLRTQGSSSTAHKRGRPVSDVDGSTEPHDPAPPSQPPKQHFHLQTRSRRSSRELTASTTTPNSPRDHPHHPAIALLETPPGAKHLKGSERDQESAPRPKSSREVGTSREKVLSSARSAVDLDLRATRSKKEEPPLPSSSSSVRPRTSPSQDTAPPPPPLSGSPTTFTSKDAFPAPAPRPSLDPLPKSSTSKPKRAPASRSSNGIETATGPPPALSTQRSYTNDLSRQAQQQQLQQDLAELERLQQQQQHPHHQPTPAQRGLSGSTLVGTGASPSKSGRQSPETEPRDADVATPRPSNDTTRPEDNDSMERRRSRRMPGQYGEDLLEDDRDTTIRGLGGTDRHDTSGSRKYVRESPQRTTRPESDRMASANEDLFMNIARTDAGREPNDEPQDPISRSERRRSRLGLPSHRQSLPQNSYSSPLIRPSAPRRDSQESSARPYEMMSSTMNASPASPHARRRSQGASSSIGHSHFARNSMPSSAASAHPLDEMRSSTRLSGLSSRASAVGGLRRDSMYSSRVPTAHDASPSAVAARNPSAYRSSTLTHHTPQPQRGSLVQDRPTTSPQVSNFLPDTPTQVEGSVSTVSNTTAPTQFWDEVDHLKSRIYQLESQRDQPVSAGAAGATNSSASGGGGGGGGGHYSHTSGDRPRTATTTVTTISSSPKRNQKKSVTSSTPVTNHGTPNATSNVGHDNLHPLLHAALAKSRPLVSVEVYRALEATAADALAMAAMTGSTTTVANGNTPNNSAASVHPGGSVAGDRQLRRKADSVCRSLTELCIALQDSKNTNNSPSGATGVARPGSRDLSRLGQHLDGGSPSGSGSVAAGATNSPAFGTPKYDSSLIINGSGGGDPDPLTLVRSNSRALSRVEARRTSLLLNASNDQSPRTTSIPEHASPADGNHGGSGSRALRTSSVMRHYSTRPSSLSANNNNHDFNDGPQDFAAPPASEVGSIYTPSSSHRPTSRAATEINFPSSSTYMRHGKNSDYPPAYPVPESLREQTQQGQGHHRSHTTSNTPTHPHPHHLHPQGQRSRYMSSAAGSGSASSSPLTHSPSISAASQRRYLPDRGSPAQQAQSGDDRRASYGIAPPMPPLPMRSATTAAAAAGLARKRMSLTGSGGGSVVSPAGR